MPNTIVSVFPYFTHLFVQLKEILKEVTGKLKNYRIQVAFTGIIYKSCVFG